MEYLLALLFLILFGVAACGFTGVALARLGRRGRNEPKRLPLSPLHLVAVPVLVIAAWYWFSGLDPVEPGDNAVDNSLFTACLFLVPLVVLRLLIGRTDWFEKGALRERWPWAAKAWIFGIPGLFAVAAVSQFLLDPILPTGSEADALHGLEDFSALDMMLMGLLACIVQPILEEMLFRGFLFRGLCGPRINLSPTRALFVSSLLFGLAHTPDMWLPGMYLGGMLAWLDWRGGDLRLPILAHCAHNTLFFVLALV